MRQEVSAQSHFGGSYLHSKRPHGGAFPESDPPRKPGVRRVAFSLSFCYEEPSIRNNSTSHADAATRETQNAAKETKVTRLRARRHPPVKLGETKSGAPTLTQP